MFLNFACQPLHPLGTLNDSSVITGAECTHLYLHLLKNKRVGLVVNQSSLIGRTPLVDSLLSSGIQVVRVFSPEHGYSGNLDAGEQWNDFKDNQTGLPVVSLYGKNKKPTPEDLSDVDIMVFDIQDVGVRFYTYLSTLHYVMEACAGSNVPLIVLDRPNPNGFYIDGPVLKPENKSFVGMHPIPVVYGMTIGEMANMIAGEKWVHGCRLTVIPCQNYDHSVRYILPVHPSPNLRSMRAVYLYPTLGLFEGTIFSVGRGTPNPFEVYGHPDFMDTLFNFIPQPAPGSSNPPYAGIRCYGRDLRNIPLDSLKLAGRLHIEIILDAYNNIPQKDDFFNDFICKLYGTRDLPEMLQRGLSAKDIREKWKDDLKVFKDKRVKYLLYDDF